MGASYKSAADRTCKSLKIYFLALTSNNFQGIVLIRVFVTSKLNISAAHILYWLIGSRVMMNISICSTALPSLGRLLVDFQPHVATFAITDRQGTRNNKTGDRYAFSNTFGHRFSPEYVKNNSLGAQASVLGSRSRQEDTESIQGLREDGLRQNVIQQTVGFEVKYTTD